MQAKCRCGSHGGRHDAEGARLVEGNKPLLEEVHSQQEYRSHNRKAELAGAPIFLCDAISPALESTNYVPPRTEPTFPAGTVTLESCKGVFGGTCQAAKPRYLLPLGAGPRGWI